MDGKIFRILCRKASEYAGIPSFCGFVCEKFYCAQNCSAPLGEDISRRFACEGGRHGGEAHRNRVQSVKDTLDKGDWDVSSNERRYTVSGGRYRYPDIIAEKDGSTLLVQVGRTTKSGAPVAREVRALNDLRGAGYRTWFVRYD